MKKLFIFLLIFIFTSPVIGHACNCCPLDHADSSRAAIQESSPDCCTEMNVLAKECQNVNLTEKATSPSSKVSFSETSPAAYFSEVARLSKPLALSGGLSSPPNLSETPLYLLHSILRI